MLMLIFMSYDALEFFHQGMSCIGVPCLPVINPSLQTVNTRLALINYLTILKDETQDYIRIYQLTSKLAESHSEMEFYLQSARANQKLRWPIWIP